MRQSTQLQEREHRGLGALAEGVKRRAHGDAVKNITCLTNVPTLKGADKDEFDV